MIFAAIFGVIIGVLGILAGIGAVLWGLGVFEYMGGRKKSGMTPQDKLVLIERILKINSPQLPYLIKPGQNADLMLEWNIIDASWWGIFSKERLKEVYRAFLLLDESRHAVRYYEELGSVEWSAGAPKVSYREQFFKGRILFRKSWGVQYGIKNNGTVGKVYQYNFDIGMIRDPIKKVVEDSGWEFVTVVCKKHATYSR